jgi:hypothetical protein
MEKLLWARLQRYLKGHKKGFWTRIESPVSPGIPDLMLCYDGRVVLVELKWTSIKRKSSKALTHKLSPEQVVWLKKSVSENISHFVLLGSVFGVILLESKVALKLNQMSFEEAEKVASWFCIKGFSGLFDCLFKKDRNDEVISMAARLLEEITE